MLEKYSSLNEIEIGFLQGILFVNVGLGLYCFDEHYPFLTEVKAGLMLGILILIFCIVETNATLTELEAGCMEGILFMWPLW